MSGKFNELDWEIYEDLVCDALRHEHPDLEIERNIHIVGHLSNQRRQIDIALKGSLAGHDVFAVVDCKHYSRKLDVNDVGSFITLLDDVSADIGILVTEVGDSKAAKTLAKKSSVKLDIRTLEELKIYRITFDWCEECSPGEDHLPGLIEWSGYDGLDGDLDEVESSGYCYWCYTLHLRCKCDAITGIPEVFYNESVECLGECGTIYLVTPEHAGSGIRKYVLSVQHPL